MSTEITDGTYTMTFDITMMPAAMYAAPTVRIDPFGEGSVSKKVPAEKVPAIVARVENEVFPKFVAYKQAKERGDTSEIYRLHNDLENIYWGI